MGNNTPVVKTTAPRFASLYEEISTRIDKFYNNSSILVDNKYIVGLFGENVRTAVAEMERDSNAAKQFAGRGVDREPNVSPKTYANMFTRWKESFVSSGETGADEVELRWTVNNVKIPMVKPQIDSTFSIDAVKSIWYPLVIGSQKTDTITLTIVEERRMGMYQFFNALMNESFFTKVLKPKSSFQKVSMYIIILNGEYIPDEHRAPPRLNKNNKEFGDAIIDIPLHVFEFNSIVLKDISPLTFKQDSPSKVTFTVTFEAPNLFQGSYETTTMKGLMDSTTDKRGIQITKDDSDFMSKAGDYNKSFFTVEHSKIPDQLKEATDSPHYVYSGPAFTTRKTQTPAKNTGPITLPPTTAAQEWDATVNGLNPYNNRPPYIIPGSP